VSVTAREGATKLARVVPGGAKESWLELQMISMDYSHLRHIFN